MLPVTEYRTFAGLKANRHIRQSIIHGRQYKQSASEQAHQAPPITAILLRILT